MDQLSLPDISSGTLPWEWLASIMSASFSEIFVFDCLNLQFITASQRALTNLQYDSQQITFLTFTDIFPELGSQNLLALLNPLLKKEVHEVTTQALCRRADDSFYPLELRIVRVDICSPQVFIGLGNSISTLVHPDSTQDVSESRFRTIVANMPGLVYQLELRADRTLHFAYLSEACEPLLGLTVAQLRADPELFISLILPEDRPGFFDSMLASSIAMKNWNWEGRIRIQSWKDTKWINLRASPKACSHNSVMWEGIMANITESKLKEFEVRQSRTRLAELQEHLLQVKEQERTRIAREIHDDLGGDLTAIKMALARLVRILPQEDRALIERADYLNSLVDRTIEAAHRIAHDLRPSILDCGIVATLDWQSKEFKRQTGINCSFISNQDEITIPSEQATAIFRMCQEALTNVAKHAKASKVRVTLVRTMRYVRLRIKDDGCGIVTADRQKKNSFGIRGMVERAKALGGVVGINPGRDGGSVVTIRIPADNEQIGVTTGLNQINNEKVMKL